MDILSLILLLKIILMAVFAGGLVFLFFASCSIYTNLTSGVPWAKIPKENINKIFSEINLSKDSLIYDLGCGDGRVLFMAEKLGYQVIGYELSAYPYVKALSRKFILRSTAVFKRKNFFKEDLSKADAIFIFLVGKVMDRVGRKLKLELKKGALVVSYGFAIPSWRPEKIISTEPSLTYIYKI